MTWRELVRSIAAEYGVTELDDDTCDYMLWERTAFPICGRDEVIRQLHDIFQEEVRAQEEQGFKLPDG